MIRKFQFVVETEEVCMSITMFTLFSSLPVSSPPYYSYLNVPLESNVGTFLALYIVYPPEIGHFLVTHPNALPLFPLNACT